MYFWCMRCHYNIFLETHRHETQACLTTVIYPNSGCQKTEWSQATPQEGRGGKHRLPALGFADYWSKMLWSEWPEGMVPLLIHFPTTGKKDFNPRTCTPHLPNLKATKNFLIIKNNDISSCNEKITESSIYDHAFQQVIQILWQPIL